MLTDVYIYYSARADRSRLMRALAGTPEERTSELKVLDSDRVALL